MKRSKYTEEQIAFALKQAELFTDTVEGLAGRLLVDEDATLVEVSQATLGTLSTAGQDDVVVITFAGHGSFDGNIGPV